MEITKQKSSMLDLYNHGKKVFVRSWTLFIVFMCIYIAFSLYSPKDLRDASKQSKIYLLDSALTPGSSLPSSSSKLAPPPVETWLSWSSTL